MCFYYDGYNEFEHDRVVTARKAHKCDACRTPIVPGEDYHYHTGKFDGHFFANKVCRRCCYDRVRVVEHELAEGCSWNEAWPPISELTDYLGESEMGQTKPEDVPASFQVGDMPQRVAKVG